MKRRYINATIFLLILLATAFAGQYIGNHFIHNKHVHQNSESANWHKLLHEKLNITPAQDAKLEKIEKLYRQKLRYLEEQMHLANMELAKAIRKDKSFTAKVQNATDKIHHVMGKLQKTTLEHLQLNYQ